MMTINVERCARLKSTDKRIVNIKPIPCGRHPSRGRNRVNLVGGRHGIQVHASVTVGKNEIPLLRAHGTDNKK